MNAAVARQTAEERREAVLQAAVHEFAHHGLQGASTDAIARTAGISQPYLFRLFGTKKDLYLAVTTRKMDETYAAFERASRGKTGQDALRAMGDTYTDLIAERERLLLMLQCFTECDDDDIRENVRRVWRDLTELAEQRSGEPPEVISSFFAKGMMLNVLTAMRVQEEPAPWADRLLEGCKREDD